MWKQVSLYEKVFKVLMKFVMPEVIMIVFNNGQGKKTVRLKWAAETNTALDKISELSAKICPNRLFNCMC